jgi:hypothetical protein
MASSIYDEALPQDLALSGPEVWPCIVADRAHDRFIFRRPEVAYLIALRRLEKKRLAEGRPEPHKYMVVRHMMLTRVDKRRTYSRERIFWHSIDHEDATSDVRAFLNKLRESLIKVMPDQVLPQALCLLQFMTQDRKVLLSFQEKWV